MIIGVTIGLSLLAAVYAFVLATMAEQGGFKREHGVTLAVLHWIFKRTLPNHTWITWMLWREEHERRAAKPTLPPRRRTTSEEIEQLRREIEKTERMIAEAKRKERVEAPATARRRDTAEQVFGIDYDDAMEQHLIGRITPQQIRDMDMDEYARLRSRLLGDAFGGRH